jgi:hypothetical protein
MGASTKIWWIHASEALISYVQCVPWKSHVSVMTILHQKYEEINLRLSFFTSGELWRWTEDVSESSNPRAEVRVSILAMFMPRLACPSQKTFCNTNVKAFVV